MTIYRLVVGEIDRLPRLAQVLAETIAVMRARLETYLRGQVHAGELDIPDPEAACHQFRMLAYGELRERMLLGENITEEIIITTTIERAVTLFLDGYGSTSVATAKDSRTDDLASGSLGDTGNSALRRRSARTA